MGERLKCIILGAAGRDFHDFLAFFRDRPQYDVCAFTATQIPFIESRSFPQSLAGPNYTAEIPIFLENDLAELIARYDVDVVFFAYSDISHVDVMHRAALVQSCGAAFALLGPKQTQLRSNRPVIAITAVRTGAGKSPLTQYLARHLKGAGHAPAVIRHPMPYGDLERQVVQQFRSAADLDRFECTVEEREEYEPYIELGIPIYSGVAYAHILSAAEPSSDVILWDGGNNDYPFIRPDLSVVVLDALRAGHEAAYHPGETNVRAADVIVINKVRSAAAEDLALIGGNLQTLNPDAPVMTADLDIVVDAPERIRGRRVLVVEDGPTTTHGGMPHGAGLVAAQRYAAGEVVDPRPHAVGSLRETFDEYPHITEVLPSCGYSEQQLEELAATIQASDAEIVIDGSPASLDRLLNIEIPIVNVRYRFEQIDGPELTGIVDSALSAND
jgi:predicted GTPase